jgi:hypothetical protein
MAPHCPTSGGRKSARETVDSVQQLVANGRSESKSDVIGQVAMGQVALGLQPGGMIMEGTLETHCQLPFVFLTTSM